MTPHGGPAFLDFPLDLVFSEAPDEGGFVPMPSARGVAGLGLESGVAPDGAAMDAAIALLRGARRPVIMAGTDLYWAPRRGRAARARRGAADPGVPQRARARLRAGRPRAVLLARAVGGAARRRRRAADRRADGLPARLRRRVRRGDEDRRDRPGGAGAALSARGATARAVRRRERRDGRAARRARRRRVARRLAGVDRLAARGRGRGARRRARAAGRRARAASPDARLRRARRACSTATRS